LPGLADPRLGGAAPGLDLGSVPLAVDPRHFACCGGTGTRLDPGCDVTRACALNARLREARRLAALYARLHDESTTVGSARAVGQPVRLSPVLGRLHAMPTGRWKKGRPLLAPPSGKVSPEAPAGAAPRRASAVATAPVPSIWIAALAAAWRFGLRPHV